MSHSPAPGYTPNYLNAPPSIPSNTHPSQGPPPPVPGNHPQYQPQYQYPPPGVPFGGPIYAQYGPPPGQPPAPSTPSQQQQWPQQPYPPAPAIPQQWPQQPYPGAPQPPYPAPPGTPSQWPQPAYPFQPPAPPVSSTLWYLESPIPTPGYPSAVPGYDPTADFENVRKATKGFGTNESLLISTLAPLRPLQMDALGNMFLAKTGKTLLDVVNKETSGWFGSALRGLVLGPLAYDVELVHDALAGLGTNETLLTDVLLARSPSDLQLLASAYNQKYKRELIEAVRGDLSGKTERMFIMAMNASPPPDTMPVNHEQVMQDVDALHKAGQGSIGTDEIVFCDILINRSQPHLTAICATYANKYRSLTKVIKSEFSGHMRAGLLFIVQGAKPKHEHDGRGVWRDAKLLEKAMEGFGTKDAMLVWRVVRAQWDPARMQAIRDAYKRRYGKTLEGRVAGETSGAYKKLLVALVGKT